jgi:hypothetical protein
LEKKVLEKMELIRVKDIDAFFVTFEQMRTPFDSSFKEWLLFWKNNNQNYVYFAVDTEQRKIVATVFEHAPEKFPEPLTYREVRANRYLKWAEGCPSYSGMSFCTRDTEPRKIEIALEIFTALTSLHSGIASRCISDYQFALDAARILYVQPTQNMQPDDRTVQKALQTWMRLGSQNLRNARLFDEHVELMKPELTKTSWLFWTLPIDPLHPSNVPIHVFVPEPVVKPVSKPAVSKPLVIEKAKDHFLKEKQLIEQWKQRNKMAVKPADQKIDRMMEQKIGPMQINQPVTVQMLQASQQFQITEEIDWDAVQQGQEMARTSQDVPFVESRTSLDEVLVTITKTLTSFEIRCRKLEAMSERMRNTCASVLHMDSKERKQMEELPETLTRQLAEIMEHTREIKTCYEILNNQNMDEDITVATVNNLTLHTHRFNKTRGQVEHTVQEIENLEKFCSTLRKNTKKFSGGGEKTSVNQGWLSYFWEKLVDVTLWIKEQVVSWTMWMYSYLPKVTMQRLALISAFGLFTVLASMNMAGLGMDNYMSLDIITKGYLGVVCSFISFLKKNAPVRTLVNGYLFANYPGIASVFSSLFEQQSQQNSVAQGLETITGEKSWTEMGLIGGAALAAGGIATFATGGLFVPLAAAASTGYSMYKSKFYATAAQAASQTIVQNFVFSTVTQICLRSVPKHRQNLGEESYLNQGLQYTGLQMASDEEYGLERFFGQFTSRYEQYVARGGDVNNSEQFFANFKDLFADSWWGKLMYYVAYFFMGSVGAFESPEFILKRESDRKQKAFDLFQKYPQFTEAFILEKLKEKNEDQAAVETLLLGILNGEKSFFQKLTSSSEKPPSQTHLQTAEYLHKQFPKHSKAFILEKLESGMREPDLFRWLMSQ